MSRLVRSSYPFKFEREAVEGYVTVFCQDRDEYGIQRILVPNDFWAEGSFLLTRVWNKVNPVIHSNGYFQDVGEQVVFHLAPATANVNLAVRAIRGIINPVFAASRSIKCMTVWPEMGAWKKAQEGTGNSSSSALEDKKSPISYMMERIRRKEIQVVPFGDGQMVLGNQAELDYLAHCT